MVPTSIVYHEVAHYYLGGPRWLSEGSVVFASAYVDAWLNGEEVDITTFDDGWHSCVDEGLGNIYDLTMEFHSCSYEMGAFFLSRLYDAMGEEPYGNALREIHLGYEDHLGFWPSEKSIYETFLAHAPDPENVMEVYGQWHGGPFLDTD